MSSTQVRENPYKGLMPYDESDAPFFFGREDESEIITANVMASRLTLLYGTSGVGKSSVLRAGVAYNMKQSSREEFLRRGQTKTSITIFNSWRDNPMNGLRKQINKDLQVLCGSTVAAAEQLSFSDFLQAATRLFGGTLLIVLDQFEEYFLYPQKEGEGSFTVEFVRAVNNRDIRVNFLISIREDWLAKLDLFKTEIPGLFDNYLRIDRLDRASALAAIQKPAAKYNALLRPGEPPVVLVDGFAEKVFAQLERLANKNLLAQAGGGEAKGNVGLMPETRIQTPYLQLVMTRLWSEAIAGARRLDPAMLADPDRSREIIQSHLDQVMDNLNAGEQAAADEVFYHLVTPSGTKITQALSDLAGYAHLSEADLSPVLEKLSTKESGVLTQIAPAPGQRGVRYEIFHDVLASPILNWCANYERKLAAAEALEEAEKQRALAEQARQRAEEERRRSRKFQFAMRGLAAACLFLVVLGGLALWQWQKAIKAQRSARASQEAAMNSELRALKSEADAKAWAEREKTSKEEAEKQRTIARTEAAAAKQARDDAERSERKAILARDQAVAAQQRAELTHALATTERDAFHMARRDEDREEAIKKFEGVFQAKIKSSDARDRQAAKLTLLDIGEVYIGLGNEPRASAQFQNAVQRSGDTRQRAELLSEIGDVYSRTPAQQFYGVGTPTFNPKEIAIEKYRGSVDLYRQINEPGPVAAALVKLAAASRETIDIQKTPADRAKLIDSISQYLEEATRLARDARDHRTLANAFYERLQTLNQTGAEGRDQGIKLLEEAAKEYELAGDNRGVIKVLKELAKYYNFIEPDRSAAYLQQVADKYHAVGDFANEAATLVQKSYSLPASAQATEHRISLLKKAVSLFEQAGNHNEALNASSMLRPLFGVEREDELVEALEHAARIARQLNRPDEEARLLSGVVFQLAYLSPKRAEPLQQVRASGYKLQVEEISKHVSDVYKPFVLLQLGLDHLWLGERAEADRTFEESLALYEERKDYYGEGSALQLIARNYIVFVRDKGIEFQLRAVKNFRTHQMTDEAWPLFELGTIYKEEALSQRSETARVRSAEYFTSAHQIFHQTGNTYYEGLGLSELATLYRDQDPSKAIEFYEKAVAVYMAKQGFAQDAAFRLNAISEIYAAQGNQAKAEEYKQRAKSVVNLPPAPPR